MSWNTSYLRDGLLFLNFFIAVCSEKMHLAQTHEIIFPLPIDITWTAKRKAWGTSESMKAVEWYGRLSLWTERTCFGTTSRWWPRRLVGTQVTFHKLHVCVVAASCLLVCEREQIGFLEFGFSSYFLSCKQVDSRSTLISLRMET